MQAWPGPKFRLALLSGLKKLTGSIPQTIAYRIPTVMHHELYAVYRDELTAPSMTYKNTESFTNALGEIIHRLRSQHDTCRLVIDKCRKLGYDGEVLVPYAKPLLILVSS